MAALEISRRDLRVLRGFLVRGVQGQEDEVESEVPRFTKPRKSQREREREEDTRFMGAQAVCEERGGGG